MEKFVKSTIALSVIGLVSAGGYLIYSNYSNSTQPIEISPTQLRPAPPTRNPNISSLLEQAQTHKLNREFREAAQKYQQAFEIDQKSNLALIGIAEVYFLVDQHSRARDAIARAEQLGQLTYEGKILKMKLAIVRQDIPQTREVFNSISENTNEKMVIGSLVNFLVYDLAEARNKLNAVINGGVTDEYSSTAQKLLNAINLYQTFTDSPRSYLYALAGKALIDENQIFLARPLLMASIEFQNDYRDAWLMLGYTYLLAGNNQDAIRSLQRAKQIDPYNAEVHFYLGLALEKTNQAEEAANSFRQASSFGFRNPSESLKRVANSLFLDQKYQEALDYYLRAQENSRLSIEEYTRMIWITVDITNQPEKALEISLQALQNYPTTPMSANLVGWANIANNNFDQAARYLQMAIEQDPELDAAYLNIGLLAVKTENYLEAEVMFKKAIELATKNRAPSIADRARNELNNLNNLLNAN